MSDNSDRLDPAKKPAWAKRLADDLAAVDAQDHSVLTTDSEMLSLMVSGALKGEDISRRYPDFYRRMLANAELLQAFVDALEAVESERAGQMAPLLHAPERDLGFLARSPSSKPAIELFEKDRWRTTWQRTLEQVRAIFSPPMLAYRADPAQLEDPWFTLLRDEIEAAGSLYSVALECTLSSETDEALSGFLSLAVTFGSAPERVVFPLRASLHWGGYQETILIPEEGRARFPDIALAAILDESQQKVNSGLSLTLQTAQ